MGKEEEDKIPGNWRGRGIKSYVDVFTAQMYSYK